MKTTCSVLNKGQRFPPLSVANIKTLSLSETSNPRIGEGGVKKKRPQAFPVPPQPQPPPPTTNRPNDRTTNHHSACQQPRRCCNKCCEKKTGAINCLPETRPLISAAFRIGSGSKHQNGKRWNHPETRSPTMFLFSLLLRLFTWIVAPLHRGGRVGVYMHVTDLCPKWLLNGEWAANRENPDV